MRESEVAQSCPTLSNPMDCSLPGSSVHGIFQARVLEYWSDSLLSQSLIYQDLGPFWFSSITTNNAVRNILIHLSVRLYSNISENFIPTSENVQSKDMNT